jgi:hypothetical protein
LEYNVVDNGQINSFLAGCSQNQATARLLGVCLERALRKGPDGLEPLTKLEPDAPGWLREKFAAGVVFHRFVPDAALEARVRHVADWIEAARVNNDEWLQRCDSQGRPLKLLKIGSLAQAEAQADKAMRRFAFTAAAAQHVDGDGEESIMTFADGSRIVRLLTPAALDRESAMMGHCVGQGAYDTSVLERSRIIYSLRDRDGKAHVTFDLKADGNELLQCRGKQNAPPVEKYMAQVRLFIESKRFVLKEAACMTGLVQDTDGKVHSISALPKGLKVRGDLSLRGTNITALPEGLSVGGHLDRWGTEITVLPESLRVCGSLFLRGTKVTALPEGLSVGGSLFLRGTNIIALPEGLSVGGGFDLEGTEITALPDGLTVGGFLDLRGTRIMALPEGLSVGGFLDLRDTKITALPEALSVGGKIYGLPKPEPQTSGGVFAAVARLLRPSAPGFNS